MAQYNYVESIKRIDRLLGFNDEKNVMFTIPRAEEIQGDQTVSVYGTVMYLSIDAKAENVENSSKILNLSLQSFLSELTAVCKSNDNCYDLVVTPSCVMAIYNTPKKADVDSVIDDAARIRSLAMVVNKESGGKVSITPSFGIDYGPLLMTLMNSPKGEKSLVWNGRTVDRARKLCEMVDRGKIGIYTIIWNNIRPANQRLFTSDSALDDYYVGNIVNVLMNNWILANEKSL